MCPFLYRLCSSWSDCIDISGRFVALPVHELLHKQYIFLLNSFKFICTVHVEIIEKLTPWNHWIELWICDCPNRWHLLYAICRYCSSWSACAYLCSLIWEQYWICPQIIQFYKLLCNVALRSNFADVVLIWSYTNYITVHTCWSHFLACKEFKKTAVLLLTHYSQSKVKSLPAMGNIITWQIWTV